MLFSILCWALLLFLVYKFVRLDCSLVLKFYETYLPNKHRLRNKTVWIVGASTGIGEELAHQLAEKSARLILTATSAEKLEQVKTECLKRSRNSLKADDILVLPYDISNFDENATAFQKIIDTYGQIDVLVANAARVYASATADNDFAHIRQLFDINYLAHVNITQLVLRHWLANKIRGKILVTSSLAAVCEFPFVSHYAASKKALNTFYRDLNLQYSTKGITAVNCMPGPVESSLITKALPTQRPVNDNPFDFFNMRTARCAHLMLVALSNRISECWICPQPFLSGAYVYSDHYVFLVARALGITKLVERHFFPKGIQ